MFFQLPRYCASSCPGQSNCVPGQLKLNLSLSTWQATSAVTKIHSLWQVNLLKRNQTEQSNMSKVSVLSYCPFIFTNHIQFRYTLPWLPYIYTPILGIIFLWHLTWRVLHEAKLCYNEMTKRNTSYFIIGVILHLPRETRNLSIDVKWQYIHCLKN